MNRVVRVSADPGYTLEVTIADGTSRTVNLSARLFKHGYFDHKHGSGMLTTTATTAGLPTSKIAFGKFKRRYR